MKKNIQNNITLFITILTLLLTTTPPLPLQATELKNNDTTILPDKLTTKTNKTTPIKIDGNLTESVWQNSTPIDKPFKTISPTYGQPFTQKTLIHTAYDQKNLYFAFQCFDTHPSKIKTSITQRDNISNDDWVGVILDATGSKQGAYEFYVNPNGIQMDKVKSAVTVDAADKAPDFVWESAAKITETGYNVEIRIPLDTIRYQGGKHVKMGAVFIRQVSREGSSGTWPEIQPGSTYFNFMAELQYHGLKNDLRLEILPNVTYSSTSERTGPATWETEKDTNIGMSIKYGITSSITAEATINPDFSQVESDAFQVEVNQRYPLFYSEKRPFFMENKQTFDFSVIKWGYMPAPVHTRKIQDPSWALKFSGSAGRMDFALLAADDRAPGQPWAGLMFNPNEGKNALFGIVRAKYNIGGDNSVGFLYSGRYFGESSNSVTGVDVKYRVFKNLRATFSYLRSVSRILESEPWKKGNGWNAMLEYRTPKLFSMLAYERYDSGFRMDSAFLNRVGIGRWVIGAGHTISPKLSWGKWLKRVMPYAYFLKLHDLESGLADTAGIFGLNLGFAPMGEFNFEYYIDHEVWQGELFRKNYVVGEGRIQILKWLHLNGNFTIGEGIYYGGGRMGRLRSYGVGVTVQPGVKFNLGLSYAYSLMRERSLSQRIYSVDIYNFRATYQFNKHFFLRGIVRYDSLQEKLVTDVLGSFTLIPGTVVHVGYGSLYRRQRWDGNVPMIGVGEFEVVRRGFFFKASYLWRL